jgi:hypothetical protein
MSRRVRRRYYADDPLPALAPVSIEPARPVIEKFKRWKIYAPIIGVGVVCLGGITWVLVASNRASAALAPTAGVGNIDSNAFISALPASGQQYGQAILNASSATGVDPFILAGIMQRESAFGTQLKPPGPSGTGDFTPRPWLVSKLGYSMPPDGQGWGRGLMQIDYWHELDWLSANDWTDPETNVTKAAQILLAKAKYLARRNVTGDLLLRGTIAAYNGGEKNIYQSISAGLDPDTTTAGGIYGNHDYSTAVLGFANQYASNAGTTIAASLPA